MKQLLKILNRTLSVLLAVTMLVTMMPQISLNAFAEEMSAETTGGQKESDGQTVINDVDGTDIGDNKVTGDDATGADDIVGGDDVTGADDTVGGDDVTGADDTVGEDDATGGDVTAGEDDAAEGDDTAGDDIAGSDDTVGGDDAIGGDDIAGGDDAAGGDNIADGDDAAGGDDVAEDDDATEEDDATDLSDRTSDAVEAMDAGLTVCHTVSFDVAGLPEGVAYKDVKVLDASDNPVTVMSGALTSESSELEIALGNKVVFTLDVEDGNKYQVNVTSATGTNVLEPSVSSVTEYQIADISANISVSISRLYSVAIEYDSEKLAVEYVDADGSETELPEDNEVSVADGSTLKIKITAEEYYDIDQVTMVSVADAVTSSPVTKGEDGYYSVVVDGGLTISASAMLQSGVKQIEVIRDFSYDLGENVQVYALINNEKVYPGNIYLTRDDSVKIVMNSNSRVIGYILGLSVSGMTYDEQKGIYTFSEGEKDVTDLPMVCLGAYPYKQFKLINDTYNFAVTSVTSNDHEGSTYFVSEAGKTVLTLETSKTNIYKPIVKVGKEKIFPDAEGGSYTKGSKQYYRYTISAEMFNLYGEGDPIEVTVTEAAEEQEITITYNRTHVDLTLCADGKEIIGKEEQQDEEAEEAKEISYTYTVHKNAKVDIKASANEGYKLIAAKAGDKKITVKKNSFTYSMTATADTAFTIESEPVYTLSEIRYKNADWETSWDADNERYTEYTKGVDPSEIPNEIGDGGTLKIVNGIYYVEIGKTYYPTITYGDREATILSGTIKNGRNEANTKFDLKSEDDDEYDDKDSYYKEESNGNSFVPDFDDAGKTLTVTLQVADADGKNQKDVSFKIYVRPEVRKYTVSGVKNKVLTQEAGGVQEYTIKSGTKNATEKYDVSLHDANTENRISDSVIKAYINDDGHLVIDTTSADGGECVEALIWVRGSNSENIVVTSPDDMFTIKVSDVKLPKPTVKFASSDDVSLTLSLAAKNVADRENKVFYAVTVTPQSVQNKTIPAGISDKIGESKTFYVRKSGASQTVKLPVSTAKVGNGEAWKFNVTAKLVYVSTAVDEDEVDENGFANAVYFEGDKTPASASATATLKNLATKNPYYEMNLKVKQNNKTKKVYAGQTNVVLGTVQFSKNTTFTSYEDVTVTDGLSRFGRGCGLDMCIDENGNIIADIPEYDGTNRQLVGTHTIQVAAPAPDGTKGATAEFKVTVQQGIWNIEIVEDAYTLYKGYKKAGSMKFNLIFNCGEKTSSTKVTYEIVDEYGEPLTPDNRLYGMVTVKNGVITVNKNYVVSAEESENIFYFKVTAADYDGNTTHAVSAGIEITSEMAKIKDLVLVTWDSNKHVYRVVASDGDSISVSDASDAFFVAVSKKKETYVDYYEEFVPVTIKSSSKAITVSRDEYNNTGHNVFTGIVPQKNVTFTATAADGSGQTVKMKINIVPDGSLGFQINGLPGTTGTSDTQIRFSDAEHTRTIDYTGGYGSIVTVKLFDYPDAASGSGNSVSNLSAYSCKLSVKNATIVSSNSGVYRILLDKQDAQVILTDNSRKTDKTLTVKFHNTCVESGQVRVTANSTLEGDFIQYTRKEELPYVEFHVGEEYAGKQLVVNYIRSEYKKNVSNYDYWQSCKLPIGEALDIDENGNVKVQLYAYWYSYSEGSGDGFGYTDMKAGTYKFAVSVLDSAASGGSTFSKASTVSIKVSNATHQAFKPATSYTIGKGIGAWTALTAIPDDAYSGSYLYLQNAIVNGQGNHFGDYFELVCDGGDYYIRVRDGIKVEEINPADMVGYLSYNVYWNKPVDIRNTVTIKITLKWDTEWKPSEPKKTVNGDSSYILTYYDDHSYPLKEEYYNADQELLMSYEYVYENFSVWSNRGYSVSCYDVRKKNYYDADHQLVGYWLYSYYFDNEDCLVCSEDYIETNYNIL